MRKAQEKEKGGEVPPTPNVGKKAERFLEGRPASWHRGYGDRGVSLGWGAAPFGCHPALRVPASPRPLPSRLCTILPGERRIILALSQHFFHNSLCHIPFQGWVGRAHSAHSVISQERTSLHVWACENPSNIMLLSKKAC